MDPEARDVLRRAVVRRELLLLLLLPLCAFGGAIAAFAAEGVYRRSGLSSLLLLASMYWGISLAAGPAQVGARLMRMALASGAPDLARRAARAGAVSAAVLALTLLAVTLFTTVRHADELLDLAPSWAKAKGVAVRVVFGLATAWAGLLTWRLVRWTRGIEALAARVPTDPADRALWGVFDLIRPVELLERAGWLDPDERLLLALGDVFVTDRRLLVATPHGPQAIERGAITDVTLTEADLPDRAAGGDGACLVALQDGEERVLPMAEWYLGETTWGAVFEDFAETGRAPDLDEAGASRLITAVVTGAPSPDDAADIEEAEAAVRPHLAEGETLLAATKVGLRRPPYALDRKRTRLPVALTDRRWLATGAEGEVVREVAAPEGVYRVRVGGCAEKAQEVELEHRLGAADLRFRGAFWANVYLLRALTARPGSHVVFLPRT